MDMLFDGRSCLLSRPRLSHEIHARETGDRTAKRPCFGRSSIRTRPASTRGKWFGSSRWRRENRRPFFTPPRFAKSFGYETKHLLDGKACDAGDDEDDDFFVNHDSTPDGSYTGAFGALVFECAWHEKSLNRRPSRALDAGQVPGRIRLATKGRRHLADEQRSPDRSVCFLRRGARRCDVC